MRLRCGDADFGRDAPALSGTAASFAQTDCRSLPCRRAIARVCETSAARNAALVSHGVIRLICATARDCGYSGAALCVLRLNGAQEGLAYIQPTPPGRGLPPGDWRGRFYENVLTQVKMDPRSGGSHGLACEAASSSMPENFMKKWTGKDMDARTPTMKKGLS